MKSAPAVPSISWFYITKERTWIKSENLPLNHSVVRKTLLLPCLLSSDPSFFCTTVINQSASAHLSFLFILWLSPSHAVVARESRQCRKDFRKGRNPQGELLIKRTTVPRKGNQKEASDREREDSSELRLCPQRLVCLQILQNFSLSPSLPHSHTSRACCWWSSPAQLLPFIHR